MSGLVETRLRRQAAEARNRPGMIVGLPTVTVLAGDLEYLLAKVEALEAAVDRDAVAENSP